MTSSSYLKFKSLSCHNNFIRSHLLCSCLILIRRQKEKKPTWRLILVCNPFCAASIKNALGTCYPWRRTERTAVALLQYVKVPGGITSIVYLTTISLRLCGSFAQQNPADLLYGHQQLWMQPTEKTINCHLSMACT